MIDCIVKKPPAPRVQNKRLRLVWNNTPKGYRCIGNDRVRRVMTRRNGGSQLVPLEDLTLAEIEAKLKLLDRFCVFEGKL